jgi:hypothetical protein
MCHPSASATHAMGKRTNLDSGINHMANETTKQRKQKSTNKIDEEEVYRESRTTVQGEE